MSVRSDEERWGRELADRLAPHLPAARVQSLLSSPSVDDRREGIRLASQHGVEEAIPRLKELLADDTPYVFQRRSVRFVTEVRIEALLALEDLYRLMGKPVDFGPAKIRKAIPIEEVRAAAEAALAELPAAQREPVVARSNAAGDSPETRAYRVLQELRRIDYQLQGVDGRTYLTPLQEQLYRDQVRTPPPHPHLVVAAPNEPTRILGYLYREAGTGRWRHDFTESSEAERARNYLGQVLRIEKSGIPRVVHDPSGRPLKNSDGSLVLAGVIPDETDAAIDYLKSAAAFMNARYATRVVAPARDGVPAPAAFAGEARPDTYVRYLFIWDPAMREVVASFYIHRDDQPDQVATDVTGGAIPAAEELQRLEELHATFPTDTYLYGGGWAPSLAACVRGFFGMEKDGGAYGSTREQPRNMSRSDG